jgi:signal transduction histidine kinase
LPAKALLRRAECQADEVLRFGRLEIDLGAREARLDAKSCDLTTHQFELLAVLAQAAGRVLSRDQIMDALRGHPLEAFDRSIDVHISRIRAAIEDDADPKQCSPCAAPATLSTKKPDGEREDAVPRIYLTVVAVLLVFALVSGWLFQHNIERARAEGREAWRERLGAWAELAQGSLPDASAPPAEQRVALLALAGRMELALALDGADGGRIAASDMFALHERAAREGRGPERRIVSLPLADGRTLRLLRPGGMMGMGNPMRPRPPRGRRRRAAARASGNAAPVRHSGRRHRRHAGVLFAAISIGAYPVVRRLTAAARGRSSRASGIRRRRPRPPRGRGQGRQVAAVAASFNRAAERIEALVGSHRSLLANASHELRSPLARMKMALALLDGAGGLERERLRREIEVNIAELDALVEEVLLASRLDAAAPDTAHRTRVDLLGLSAEEAARFDAEIGAASALAVDGDERLLRRALRNLLENARRHGGGEITVATELRDGNAIVRVCDRGPGVPEALRERIFEAFYRLPGQSEQAGGVGLGLALVKQIAERHGGSVRCSARDGGGSCFQLVLPAAMLAP